MYFNVTYIYINNTNLDLNSQGADMIIEIWIKRRKGAALAFHIYPNYNPVKSFFCRCSHFFMSVRYPSKFKAGNYTHIQKIKKRKVKEKLSNQIHTYFYEKENFS